MRTHPSSLKPFLIAGASALVIVSVPLTLGLDVGGDRATVEAPVKDNRSDIQTAEWIRTALAEEPGLSESAKNVKVIANKGSIFLRGNVASEAEKEKVVAIAKRISTTRLIDNDLEVVTE